MASLAQSEAAEAHTAQIFVAKLEKEASALLEKAGQCKCERRVLKQYVRDYQPLMESLLKGKRTLSAEKIC
eukprot:5780617-Karenia_brevis.AAC.1